MFFSLAGMKKSNKTRSMQKSIRSSILVPILEKSEEPLKICNTSGSGCILCNYVVVSPRCKCLHNYCDFCLQTKITYNKENKCFFCINID